MNVSVDWLSFTLWHDVTSFESDREAVYAALDILDQRFGVAFALAATPGGYLPGNGRKPYAASLRGADDGIAIYASAKQPHFLVELSGKGCQAFRELNYLDPMIADISHRVTRIDLACDMECETDPAAFANRRNRGRFKSNGLERSSDGCTVYVGARKSNRWAKVYRYNEPHPRHRLLRAEHTFKGEDGKNLAAFLTDRGYEAAAAQCCAIFGWKHPSWTIEAPSEVELKAHRPERKQSKTIFWLYDTIGPLMARLINEGDLDAEAFWNDAVAPHLKPDA